MPGLMNMILEAKKIDPDTATKQHIASALKESQEKYLAVAFLLGSDRNQYGKLIENLENDFTQGQDIYPRDKVPAKPEQNRTIWSVFASGFRAKQSRNLTVTV
jgi:GTPase Era involved in 16S rRNA processing